MSDVCRISTPNGPGDFTTRSGPRHPCCLRSGAMPIAKFVAPARGSRPAASAPLPGAETLGDPPSPAPRQQGRPRDPQATRLGRTVLAAHLAAIEVHTRAETSARAVTEAAEQEARRILADADREVATLREVRRILADAGPGAVEPGTSAPVAACPVPTNESRG